MCAGLITWAFFRCIDAALLGGFELGASSLVHPLFWGSVGLGLAGQVCLHSADGFGKVRDSLILALSHFESV